MKRSARIALSTLLAAQLAGPHSVLAAFFSRGTTALSASVTTGKGRGPIVIKVIPVPNQAFFGKNLTVPITISQTPGPIDTKNLTIEIVYQMLDANGSPMTAYNGVPIKANLQSSVNGTTLSGVAVVPRSDLVGVENGGSLNYFFRARQNGTDTVLAKPGLFQAPAGSPQSTAPTNPFQVSIITSLSAPVGPAGAKVSVPDLYANDGRTTITFDPGALSAPGTLVVQQQSLNGWPTGPFGTTPLVVYTFTLQSTQLTRTANISLSYPAEPNGKVTGSNANPMDLAPYWLDSTEWRLLSLPQTDTTLHTVTSPTPHFSTFGLFATGAPSSADLRPAERIITPNGDGINDRATFGTGIDEVKIFDIRGRRVKTVPGPTPSWDGTDDGGAIVESGIYIFQYKLQGDRVSGVILVAK